MPPPARDVLAQIRERMDYHRFYSEFCGHLKGSGDWRDTLCLFHDDHDPSMGVNLRHGGFRCMACGAHGDFVDFYRQISHESFVEAVSELARRVGIEWEPHGESEPEEAHLEIASAIVASAHERLMGTSEELDYLTSERGLTEEIIIQHEIGHDGRRYYIPIVEDGRYVNVRRYDPHARAGNKMISWRTGYGEARLYPMGPLLEAPPGDEVFLFEGEWDCLLARSLGLKAFTSTGGAGTWREGWNVLFHDLRVVICYDADPAGCEGARKVAESLAR